MAELLAFARDDAVLESGGLREHENAPLLLLGRRTPSPTGRAECNDRPQQEIASVHETSKTKNGIQNPWMGFRIPFSEFDFLPKRYVFTILVGDLNLGDRADGGSAGCDPPG